MAKLVRSLRSAVLGSCSIVALAGCNGDPTKAPASSAGSKVSTSRRVCATVAMADKRPAVLDMRGEQVALEIPSALEVQGSMTGGVAIVEFDRPQYGKLECRYEQESDGTLSLRSCAEGATRGALVAADRMSVRLANSATASPDMTITACTVKGDVPGPLSERSLPPGFVELPSGEVLSPSPEGIAIESERDEFGMTGELEQEYRATAAEDASVLKRLGARFAYVYLDTIDPPKWQKPDSIHVKLWFFSHTYNKSVWVVMKNGVVEESGETTDVFLPEGIAEVQAAVALARSHNALAGRLHTLEGNGMAAVPLPGLSWVPNRVIDVRFCDEASVAKFYALVDLTNERVIEAGPVTP